MQILSCCFALKCRCCCFNFVEHHSRMSNLQFIKHFPVLRSQRNMMKRPKPNYTIYSDDDWNALVSDKNAERDSDESFPASNA